jgi:hypothetical protein
MMTKRVLWAALIFAAGISTGLALAGRLALGDAAQTKVVLDNQRVTVTEVTVAPQGRREPYARPSDQIIVFVDEAEYEATDAEGKKQTKRRRPGEIVWHHKGEAAPLLVNVGQRPYRSLVIALK